MASLYPNAKGQFIVEVNIFRQRILTAFPTTEQAETFKAHAEQEERVSRAKGQPTPFIKNLIEAKAQRAAAREAAKTKEAAAPHYPLQAEPKRKGKTLAQYWQQFIENKEASREWGTIKRYREVWKIFLEFLPQHITHIEQINREVMEQFVIWLNRQEDRWTTSTNKTTITHLRAFFNWATNNDYIHKSPMKGQFDIRSRQSFKKPFLYLPEVEALLEEAENQANAPRIRTRRIARDKHLFIGMAFLAGMRAAEIHLAKWNHIPNLELLMNPTLERLLSTITYRKQREDLEKLIAIMLADNDIEYPDTPEKTIEFVNSSPGLSILFDYKGSMNIMKTKSKLSRTIPLSRELKQILFKYAPERQSDDEFIVRPEKTEFLLKNGKETKRRFDDRSLIRHVLHEAELKTVNRWGIEQKITPHIGRYTYCSLLLQQGIPSDTVRRYAGHTTKQMGDLYQHLLPEKTELSFR